MDGIYFPANRTCTNPQIPQTDQELASFSARTKYVDGGLVSPVPVRFARQMGADIVVAVDISNPPEGNLTGDTLQILLQTFAIMGKSINQYELKEADLVVRPSQTGLKSADFSARQLAIESGRAAMLAALPALKARLAAGIATSA